MLLCRRQGCGHDGIFSGSKFRESIYPELRKFIRAHHEAQATRSR
jgi:poly(3-hydroxybutyrate) depolymerase